MRICVLKSSPHPKGASNLLADEFMRGARESGHTLEEFDAARLQIHPCLGCDYCGMSGPCCQKDDMAKLRTAILACDLVVFVTPLYYFGFSAQLKRVIDRFYAFNGTLMSRRLKSVLITAAWNSDHWTMQDISAHYLTLCQYLHMDNRGMILATGCGTRTSTAHSRWPEKAYLLGKQL